MKASHFRSFEPANGLRPPKAARGAAAGVGRQVRRDLRELLLRQPELLAIHRLLPFASREPHPAVHAKALAGPDPSAFASQLS